jgi:hypothetical protein
VTVIELEPVDYYCMSCDSAMEWTACHAPFCRGYRCLNCGAGCDLNEAPDDGACVTALATMSYAVAEDLRDDRRLSIRRHHPSRTLRLSGECS